MSRPSKSEQVLISVIVPVYNTAECLIDCLSGLCVQTFKDIEIICIDDGSTDNSLEILRKFEAYDKRIKVLTQSNQGVSAARNAALDMATGKYIAFVDSDDYVSPYMFSRLYDIITKNKIDIVLFNYFLDRDGIITVNSDLPSFVIDCEEEYLKLLLMDDEIRSYLCFRLYKKELFDNVRFPLGKIFEDIYLSNYLIGKIKKVYYTNEPLYYYRYRKDSLTNSLNISSIEDAIDSFFVRFKHVKKEYPDIMDINVYSILKWFSFIIENFEKDKYNDFYKMFDKIIKEIIEEAKKIDITSFSNNYKYQDVLKFIEGYKKYCSKKRK